MSKLLQIIFAFIIIGFFVFYGEANWNDNAWVKSWYIWNDVSIILLILERIISIRNPKAKNVLLILLSIFSFRLIWTIIYFIKPAIALTPLIIFCMWLIIGLEIALVFILTKK